MSWKPYMHNFAPTVDNMAPRGFDNDPRFERTKFSSWTKLKFPSHKDVRRTLSVQKRGTFATPFAMIFEMAG